MWLLSRKPLFQNENIQKKNPQSEVIAKSPETIDAQENVPQKSPENTARNNLIFLIENLKITAKRQNARSPEDLAEVIVKVFDHCFDIVLNNDEEECENCKKLEKKHLEKMELLKSEIIDVLDGCENN